MPGHRLLQILLMGSLLLIAGPVYTAEQKEGQTRGDDWRYPARIWELGASIGGGLSFARGPHSASYFAMLPRVGVRLVKQEAFVPGSLQLIAEPGLYVVGDGQTAAVGSLALLLKYNFWTGTRWIPFVSGGGGVSYASAAIPHGASHFNFLGEAGVGLQYGLTARQMLSLEWRYLHISNGRTANTNPSINGSLFLLGYTVGL
jgi:opacity protein-like surface antigen